MEVTPYEIFKLNSEPEKLTDKLTTGKALGLAIARSAKFTIGEQIRNKYYEDRDAWTGKYVFDRSWK